MATGGNWPTSLKSELHLLNRGEAVTTHVTLIHMLDKLRRHINRRRGLLWAPISFQASIPHEYR
jgi:hypothetical protein